MTVQLRKTDLAYQVGLAVQNALSDNFEDDPQAGLFQMLTLRDLVGTGVEFEPEDGE